MARRKASNLFWTSPVPYSLPSVKRGDEKSLPENRPAIIEKIRRRLEEEKKAIRQNYSNGEFITSSIIIGTRFEEVADRRMELDGAANEAHYDPKLGWWWRRGGCFD
jgi:hypothetical protein